MLTKKQKIIYFIMCIILLLVGFSLGYILNSKEKALNTNCKESTKKDTPKEETTKINKTLYYHENGRNIYTYGINRVTVNKQSLTVLDDVFKVVENLTSEYKLLEEYDDGGSKLYQINDDNRVDEKVNMLICNTLDGNTDIYFGNTNLKYEKEFCKTNNDGTFTKTYHVLNILDSDSDETNYLVLRAFQRPDDVYIAKVSKYLLPEINENDPCEFTFQYTENLIKERSIESIFENAELIKVKKTDKLGLIQTNDSIKDKYLIKE